MVISHRSTKKKGSNFCDGLDSPPPPKILKWDSPPSPFLEPIYIPWLNKRLPTRKALPAKPKKKSLFSKRPAVAPASFAAPFHQKLRKRLGVSSPTEKTPFATEPGTPRTPFGNAKTTLFNHLSGKNPLEREPEKATLTNEAALKTLTPVTSSAYFDPEIDLHCGKSTFRRRRRLKLVKPGTFEKRAHIQRAKLITLNLIKEDLDEKEDEKVIDEEFGYFKGEDISPKDDEGSSLIKRETVKIAETPTEEDLPKENKNNGEENTEKASGFLAVLEKKKKFKVEWWDRDLLRVEDYSLGDGNYSTEMITRYVQHPLLVKPVLPPRPVEPVPLFLTQKEKKKAKRMKKRARLEIKGERVRLGLEEAPAARVSLANIMRVLGNSAVADPSAVEQKVRAQVQKRRATHLLQNELRKLSPAERAQKKRKKLAENLSGGATVAVFVVVSLADPKTRFKVDISASQYGLSGCAVITPRGAVIVVEGGPKGIEKFCHLLLQRIKWRRPPQGGAESGEEESTADEREIAFFDEREAEDGGCVCVWKGMSQRRAFVSFAIEICKSEAAARRYFVVSKVPQYWDICKVAFDAGCV